MVPNEIIRAGPLRILKEEAIDLSMKRENKGLNGSSDSLSYFLGNAKEFSPGHKIEAFSSDLGGLSLFGWPNTSYI